MHIPQGLATYQAYNICQKFSKRQRFVSNRISMYSKCIQKLHVSKKWRILLAHFFSPELFFRGFMQFSSLLTRQLEKCKFLHIFTIPSAYLLDTIQNFFNNFRIKSQAQKSDFEKDFQISRTDFKSGLDLPVREKFLNGIYYLPQQ